MSFNFRELGFDGMAYFHMGEMSRFYGLPNTQAGCISDAKQPGAQAIMEKTLSTLPLVLSGVDVVSGTGEIDTSQLLVLEQIVVDHEIAQMCQRIREGIDVAEQKQLFEDVRSAGPGGHFLLQPGTLKYCRSEEFYQPELSDRNTYEDWEELERPDLYSQARKKVAEILSCPQKNPLDDDTIGKLEEIAKKADEDLNKDKKRRQ